MRSDTVAPQQASENPQPVNVTSRPAHGAVNIDRSRGKGKRKGGITVTVMIMIVLLQLGR